MSKKVNLRLPGELIEKADVAGKVFHKSRTEIIKEALQEYLQEVEDQEWFKEAVVELYLDDENGFDILKEYIGRQDAESVRASKALLEQGDGAANAAETTSNVVRFDVRERGKIEIDLRRQPSSDILRRLGTVRDSISDVFSRFTGNDDTVRRRRREP